MLLGTNKRADPEFRKQCLDAWLDTGSVNKAGELLGVSPTTIAYHSWRYLLLNLDEARELLNSQAKEDSKYGKQVLSDEQFFRILSAKGITYLPPGKFREWIEANKLYRYPSVLETYKVKYPTWYDYHRKLAIAEEVEGLDQEVI